VIPTSEPARVIRIAIVDDEPSVRVSLRRLCTALGMEATAYPSGRAFLDSLVDTAAPDCVLLDMHMPGMNGLEVQRQLATLTNRIAVIAVTADDAVEARARWFAGGAAAHLRKPIGDFELSSAVGAATGWR
jgi:FixJ family two-component response regulator